MKSIVDLIVIAMTSSAFAGVPDRIVCAGQAIYEDARNFSIAGLGSDGPDISIRDAQFMEQSTDGESLDLSFSNECDNMYTFSVSKGDLAALAAGRVSSVSATLDYAQAGYEDPTDGDDEIEEKITVTCKLP